MNDKAISMIGLNIFDYVLMNVLGENTTNKNWDNVGLLYEDKFPMNLIFMRKEFYTLNTKD
jgi:hypothetical protein